MRTTRAFTTAKRRAAAGLIPLVAAAAAAFAPPAGAATVDVRIERTAFAPATVTVSGGDTVRWTNRASTNHQVVSETGVFASPILRPGQSFSFVFRQTGTFRYRDTMNASARGAVVVNAPPASVTLAVSAPIVGYGGETHLQGVVSSRAAGEQLTLFHAPHGQLYSQLTVVTTGPGGVFDVPVRPTLLTAYAVQYKGVMSPEARVQVRPAISLMPGGRGFFLTRVTGGHSFAGRYVYLQRRSSFGQWVSVGRYRLGINSGRLFRVPNRRGVARYRMFMTINQAGIGYLEGWSGTQTVRRR